MSVIINGTTGIDKVQDGVVTDGKLLLTANSQEIKDALNASGNAPIYACRAWVNFNGTGTVAIRASGNVSSITDNAVGDYTVNFTTEMPDANYIAVMGGVSAGVINVYASVLIGKEGVTPTPTAFRLMMGCWANQYWNGIPPDIIYGNVAFFR